MEDPMPGWRTSSATPVSTSPGSASTLTVAEHIEILEAEGRRFRDVVARTPSKRRSRPARGGRWTGSSTTSATCIAGPP